MPLGVVSTPDSLNLQSAELSSFERKAQILAQL